MDHAVALCEVADPMSGRAIEESVAPISGRGNDVIDSSEEWMRMRHDLRGDRQSAEVAPTGIARRRTLSFSLHYVQ